VELPSIREVEGLLNRLRGRADPMVARRFACECVRRIWAEVESQPYVSTEVMEQCRRAVELTERSLVGPVPEGDLRAIDFEVITDAGNEAFMAATHVGWNLFAPLNGLHEIDEFDLARETAFLVACVAGSHEVDRQVGLLQRLTTGSAGKLAQPGAAADPGPLAKSGSGEV
jgi:hypothetical protein